MHSCARRTGSAAAAHVQMAPPLPAPPSRLETDVLFRCLLPQAAQLQMELSSHECSKSVPKGAQRSPPFYRPCTFRNLYLWQVWVKRVVCSCGGCLWGLGVHRTLPPMTPCPRDESHSPMLCRAWRTMSTEVRARLAGAAAGLAVSEWQPNRRQPGSSGCALRAQLGASCMSPPADAPALASPTCRQQCAGPHKAGAAVRNPARPRGR